MNLSKSQPVSKRLRSSHPITTIIVPVYNEEEGLPIVLNKIFQVIDENFEVLVIDDGSTDESLKAAARFPCRVTAHQTNQGKGEAMKTGIRQAKGRSLIFIDADDTYPVETIPEIAKRLEEFDMVLTSRTKDKRNIPFLNRIGNTIVRGLVRRLYGLRVSDPLTGFYGIKRIYLEQMRLDSTGFGIESEIAVKASRMGLKIMEIPIQYRKRIGESKLNRLKDGYNDVRTILACLALYNPILTFVAPGIALFTFGIVLMGFLLIRPIGIGSFTLGVHSFALGAMASLVGFQLSTLGFAAELYAIAHKFVKPSSMGRFFLQNFKKGIINAIGVIMIVLGLILGFRIVSNWVTAGFGVFRQTKIVILVFYMVVFGLQLVFCVSFLSILQRELRKR